MLICVIQDILRGIMALIFILPMILIVTLTPFSREMNMEDILLRMCMATSILFFLVV